MDVPERARRARREACRCGSEEAREEAGVSGTIADQPLTCYVYPGGSDGPGEPRVAAFLLEVTSQSAPAADERSRDPAWFDPETAESKLSAGGRERKYSEEHVRVLHAALAELTAETAQA